MAVVLILFSATTNSSGAIKNTTHLKTVPYDFATLKHGECGK